MTHANTAIERFLLSLEHGSSARTAVELAALFSDPFLVAVPQGTKCVCAADFVLALPKRKQLFESLGHKSTTLISLDPIVLDPRYTLVKTRWRFAFAAPEQTPQEILADSVFLVDTAQEPFKIVLYLNSQDVVALLGERGVPSG